MIDKNIIDIDLGIELAGGSEKIAKELLGLLIDELPKFEADLLAAMNDHDEDSIAKIAHKLHGGVCYVGTPNLKKAAKILELAAKEHKKVQISGLLQALLNEIHAVTEAYSSFK